MPRAEQPDDANLFAQAVLGAIPMHNLAEAAERDMMKTNLELILAAAKEEEKIRSNFELILAAAAEEERE
jgi:hypothetical protein